MAKLWTLARPNTKDMEHCDAALQLSTSFLSCADILVQKEGLDIADSGQTITWDEHAFEACTWRPLHDDVPFAYTVGLLRFLLAKIALISISYSRFVQDRANPGLRCLTRTSLPTSTAPFAASTQSWSPSLQSGQFFSRIDVRMTEQG